MSRDDRGRTDPSRTDPSRTDPSRTDGGPASALDPLLLEVVVCPACKGPLAVRAGGLGCDACALEYPVLDGIPVLLADSARSTRATDGG